MKPSKHALIAMQLGNLISLPKWSAFRSGYEEIASEAGELLDELGFSIDLPKTVEEFDEREDELHNAILFQIMAKRARLGGEVYALPLYLLGGLTLDTILKTIFDHEISENLNVLAQVLKELSIESDSEVVHRFLRTETQWLAEQVRLSDNNTVAIKDAGYATSRFFGRIIDLWHRAENVFDSAYVELTRQVLSSVFISHNSSDADFCNVLYEALKEHGIQVWYDEVDMRGGKRVREQIDHAQASYDRTLLVLSHGSMRSGWVELELRNAFQREKEEERDVLYPVTLVPIKEVQNWSLIDNDTGRDLARDLRSYHIVDFTDWRDSSELDRKVDEVISSLSK